MKLNLKKLIDGTESFISFDQEIQLDKRVVGEHIIMPVTFTGNVYADSNRGVITGKVRFDYEDDCARCLVDTVVNVEADIDAELVREGTSESNEDEDSIVEYSEDEIFIEELLSSIVVASSPMRVICSEDCRGLCPECGADLNKESCNCEIDNVDPRLAKLKDFFN